MQSTLALVALAAVAYAAPQPASGSAPADCSASYSGTFQITAVKPTVEKRDLSKRTCGEAGSLVISLSDGVLHDAKGRTGYIASNYQFQFDGPPQANAISTSGYSACSNGSLALGGSAVWYECLSGTFYNLYDRNWAPQCEPILIDILPCSSTSPAVGQKGDGQPTGTSVGVATEIPDGQPQAPSATPITEIGDGQPQAPTVLPSPAPAPVSQISDGQPQVPTPGPAPVSQISDGQPQAPTGVNIPVPISQLSDGQPQVPTPGPAPISQISDGQPQAPTGLPTLGPGPESPAPTPSFTGTINPGGPAKPAPATANGTTPVGTAPVGTAPAGTAPSGSSPTSPAGTSTPGSPAVNAGNAVGGSFAAAAVGVIAAALL